MSDTDRAQENYSFSEEGAHSQVFTKLALVRQPLMPTIRGMDILRQSMGTVDVEKTIADMHGMIASMEEQLRSVMAINAFLETDVREYKEIISELTRQKSALEERLDRMESELPYKHAMEEELELIKDERTRAQISLHDYKHQADGRERVDHLTLLRIEELESEKKDLLGEVSFLEKKLSLALEKIEISERYINVLKGENVAHLKAVNGLEQEVCQALEEKEMLMREVTEVRSTIEDIRSKINQND